MVCEEKSVEYTLTETRLAAPELFTVHPLGKMPVLHYGDVRLFESKAIATYLDRVFGPGDLSFGAPSAGVDGTVGVIRQYSCGPHLHP